MVSTVTHTERMHFLDFILGPVHFRTFYLLTPMPRVFTSNKISDIQASVSGSFLLLCAFSPVLQPTPTPTFIRLS